MREHDTNSSIFTLLEQWEPVENSIALGWHRSCGSTDVNLQVRYYCIVAGVAAMTIRANDVLRECE